MRLCCGFHKKRLSYTGKMITMAHPCINILLTGKMVRMAYINILIQSPVATENPLSSQLKWVVTQCFNTRNNSS